MKNWQDFIYWEAQSRQTIDFKLVYVDIAGDLIAGLMLSQIIYWHLPTKNGYSKLRVVDCEGGRWMAKRYNEWYDELRLTEDQARRGIKILKDLGLVETQTMRFQNLPTLHIRLNKEALLIALRNLQKKQQQTADHSGPEPTSAGIETGGSGFKTGDGGIETTSGGFKPISNNRDYTEITTETTARARARENAAASVEKSEPEKTQAREAAEQLEGLGVNPITAEQLVLKHKPPAVLQQIEWMQHRQNIANPAAYVVRAIEQNYLPPKEAGVKLPSPERQQLMRDLDDALKTPIDSLPNHLFQPIRALHLNSYIAAAERGQEHVGFTFRGDTVEFLRIEDGFPLFLLQNGEKERLDFHTACRFDWPGKPADLKNAIEEACK